MKKIIGLVLSLALLSVFPSFAQKGVWSVGFDVGGGVAISSLTASRVVYDRLGSEEWFYWVDHDYNQCIIQFGGTLKIRYGFSNYYMIQPFVSLWGGGMKKKEIQTGIDNIIFMSSIHKVRPYFLVGASYVSLPMKFQDRDKTVDGTLTDNEVTVIYEENFNINNIAIRAGFGMDARLSHHISLQLEVLGMYIPFLNKTFKDHMNDLGYHDVNNSFHNSLGTLIVGPRLKIGLTYNI